MAEAATRPYNLRSREEVMELPVQLHLSDDNRFMSSPLPCPPLLTNMHQTHQGEVDPRMG